MRIYQKDGEEIRYVTFPRARTVKGSRVFDYVVEAQTVETSGGRLSSAAASTRGDTRPPVTRKLVAAGFAYPEECADIPGECLFSATELPHDKPIRFTVTPRDCFGLAGKPLVATFTAGKG